MQKLPKVVTILGARPQFIKAVSVSKALKGIVEERIVHTGQHFDANMSQVFFDQLALQNPDYNLHIHSCSHGAMTGNMLIQLESILKRESPSAVLIYGDTNSTLAGALAASKLHIPIVHVEAGLRSFNRKMPEEINRVVADHLASINFAPTQKAVDNLAREGITSGVHQVGDVMYDLARMVKNSNLMLDPTIKNRLNQEFILVTIHREENTSSFNQFSIILRAFYEIAKQIQVIFPVHPRVRSFVQQFMSAQKELVDLILLDPLDYYSMQLLLKESPKLVATDSGGLQKEAYFYEIPCLTLRTETEWVELIEETWNTLLEPLDSNRITQKVFALLSQTKPDTKTLLYGNGRASASIARILEVFLRSDE